MDVVCCCDNKFIMPTGIMLKSLCENNVNVKIHVIIDDTVTGQDKKNLVSIVKNYDNNDIFFYLVKDVSFFLRFPSLDLIPRITKSTYYRLFLTDLLPKTLEKVLYLDSDIIIRHDLTSLWKYDVNGYALGCIIEQSIDDIEIYNRLMYPHEYGYFNAGVLLINLVYWRRFDLSSKFLRYIRECPERIKYHDQDVLNGVLYKQKMFLPIKYNVQTAFFYKKEYSKYDYLKYGNEINDAKKNPFIVHFSTEFKPWNKDCTHPFRESFLYYKGMTQWKDVRLVEEFYPNKTLRNIIGDLFRLLRLRKKILVQRSDLYFDNKR